MALIIIQQLIIIWLVKNLMNYRRVVSILDKNTLDWLINEGELRISGRTIKKKVSYNQIFDKCKEVFQGLIIKVAYRLIKANA